MSSPERRRILIVEDNVDAADLLRAAPAWRPASTATSSSRPDTAG